MYAGCSLWLTRAVWGDPTNRWIGVGGDAQAFMWWLEWVPYALREGLNPLHPTLVQYPEGVNALWNTSILLPGLVMAPVTWAFGPVLSWNLLHATAPVASALVAMAAIGRFVQRRVPAFVGGLVYGFSPYMTLKMLVHTNLVITVLPPLLLLAGHELFVRRRHSPVLVGAVLGVAMVAQLLTGSELLLVSVIAATLTVAVLALLVRRAPTVPWRDGARGLGVAAAVALIGAAPFIWFQFFGPRSAGCCVPGVERYALDAQTLVIPSPFQAFHTSGAFQMSRQWQGLDESNAYLGVPLLVVLVVAVVLLRRRRAVQVAAIMLGVLTVLAFGVEVHFAGEPTGIEGPWRLLQHLPLFGSIVVGRFMAVAYLAVGLIVAIALDALVARRAQWPARVGIGALALALVGALPTSAPVTQDTTPAFFSDDAAMDQLLGDDPVVLTSPYFASDAMLWQATAGFRYPLIHGNVFTVGPDGTPEHNGPLIGVGIHITNLITGSDDVEPVATDAQRRKYLDELAERGVTTILVGPSANRAAVERFVSDLVEDPGTTSGGVTVYRLDV